MKVSEIEAEMKRWRENRFREWERDRVRSEVLPRLLFLVFILGVLALGMMHVSSRM
jgi:hypothetical protein